MSGGTSADIHQRGALYAAEQYAVVVEYRAPARCRVGYPAAAHAGDEKSGCLAGSAVADTADGGDGDRDAADSGRLGADAGVAVTAAARGDQTTAPSRRQTHKADAVVAADRSIDGARRVETGAAAESGGLMDTARR